MACTLRRCLLPIRERVNIFGVKVLSHKAPGISVTRKVIEEILGMAIQYKMITDNLLKYVVSEDLKLTEEVVIEISKLNVNSYISQEYSEQILESTDEREDGSLDLYDDEMATVQSCLRSLIESKKVLLKSSISLELH